MSNSTERFREYVAEHQCPVHRVIHSDNEVRQFGGNRKDGGFFRVNSTGRKFPTRVEAEWSVCPLWARARSRERMYGKIP